MEKQENGQYAKGQYHVELKNKARQIVEALEFKPENGQEFVFGILKELTLQSWNNGIQAGKRKASQKTAETTKSA